MGSVSPSVRGGDAMCIVLIHWPYRIRTLTTPAIRRKPPRNACCQKAAASHTAFHTASRLPGQSPTWIWLAHYLHLCSHSRRRCDVTHGVVLFEAASGRRSFNCSSEEPAVQPFSDRLLGRSPEKCLLKIAWVGCGGHAAKRTAPHARCFEIRAASWPRRISRRLLGAHQCLAPARRMHAPMSQRHPPGFRTDHACCGITLACGTHRPQAQQRTTAPSARLHECHTHARHACINTMPP